MWKYVCIIVSQFETFLQKGGAGIMNIELLKELESRGEWARIASLTRSDFAELQGNDLARAFVSLAVIHERMATGASGYRTALRYAMDAVAVAVPQSPVWGWAQHLVACYAADFGNYDLAGAAADAYLDIALSKAELKTVLPYVNAAKARVLSRQGKHREAIDILEMTLYAPMTEELRERVSIILSRVYARARLIGEAERVLPESVQCVGNSKLLAAKALIYGAMGDWTSARQTALEALRLFKTEGYRVYDVIEVVELLLTLKKAAEHFNRTAEAFVWTCKAVLLLSAWNVHAVRSLASFTPEQKGGEIDAAASHRCIAGYHRCGLAGTVG